MNGRGFFVAGTDTGVGKTWVTVRLLEELRHRRSDAVGMKPVECGGRDDARAILEASGGERPGIDLDLVNPCPFPEPLAPICQDGFSVDFDFVKEAYRTLSTDRDLVFVEGAGGWLVPLDRDRTLADLAAFLELPVILVAANRLGVLNHALLTIRAINLAGLVCPYLFLNEPFQNEGPDRETNAAMLRSLLPAVEVISEIDDLASRLATES